MIACGFHEVSSFRFQVSSGEWVGLGVLWGFKFQVSSFRFQEVSGVCLRLLLEIFSESYIFMCNEVIEIILETRNLKPETYLNLFPLMLLFFKEVISAAMDLLRDRLSS